MSGDPLPTTRGAPGVLRWAGVSLMLLAATARGLTPQVELPHWDMDPLTLGGPVVGVGPGGSMVFDLVALLGAGLALLGEAVAGRRMEWGWCGLAAIGAAAVVWHGWVSGDSVLGNQRVGASWLAAIACGVAAASLCRGERMRRVVVATVLGFAAALAVKGAQQVLIEHAQTVAAFKRNGDQMLRAQGWTPDSPMARAYIRRLMQPEATGWYGLANVYASLMAAAMVAGVTVLAAGLTRLVRTWDRGGRALLGGVIAAWLGAAVAATGIALAGSKGGYIAAGAGVIAVLAFLWLGTRGGSKFGRGTLARLGGGVGVGAILGAISIVVLRGTMGASASQLSLLFRWLYMQAAARIGLTHPLLGVGPDGFQEAYLTAKSPLSPEDVRSPHCIVLDWWATLGVFGLAWVALLVWWMWRAGRRAVIADSGPPPDGAAPDSSTDGGLHGDMRLVCLIAAIGTILGAWLDNGVMSLDGAAARVVGLVVWCGVAWGVLRVLREVGASCLWWRAGLAGSAAALAAHGQIDVVASWAASAAVFFLVIGAAAASDGATGTPRSRSLSLAPGLVGLALAALIGVRGVRPALAWESDLRDAAAELGNVGLAGQRLQLADEETDRAAKERELRELAAELSLGGSGPVGATPEAIRSALGARTMRAIPGAIDRLLAADAIYPGEWRPRREASRLALLRGGMLLRAGQGTEAAQWMGRAVELADPGAGPREPRASQLAWLALVYQSRYEQLHDRADLSRAAESLERAVEKDPYNLDASFRLFRLYQELGDSARARRWAGRAIQLDDLSWLDREGHGLLPAERRELEGAAAKP